MKRLRKRRPIAQTALLGCVLLSMVLWAGPRPARSSTCVACHTDETTLKSNLSPAKEKKSALTSGAG